MSERKQETLSDLSTVLHWMRPSNWSGVESGKAAQTVAVITDLRAENERLRAEVERLHGVCQSFAREALRQAYRRSGGQDGVPKMDSEWGGEA